MMNFTRFVFFLICFLTLPAHAQFRFLVPSDREYRIYDTPELRTIYAKEYQPLVPELIKQNRLFKEIYEKEFNWVFDDHETLILASSQNQIANGFATVLPRLHTVFYGNSPDLVDEFSVRSWLQVLLAHETSHLYQLNVKRGYSKTLTEWFGRTNPVSPTAFFPPFTYVQHPNVFLPTIFLEGNAVYNEGRFGNGGRLYNGAARALLLQLLNADKINWDRWMNDHIDFPYGREKYLLGGFFFLDLAERYGSENANRFFYEHADFKFNPFQIDIPFQLTYQKGYEAALGDFKKRWKPLADQQKRAPGPVLFESISHVGFSQTEKEILFLTTSGQKLPRLRSYNLQNHSWQDRAVNLPMGRVFRLNDGRIVAASSQTVRNNEIRAGLFGEGYEILEKELGRSYYDIRGARRIWADAKTSFVAPNIYAVSTERTPRHYGEASSAPILGRDNEVYFFRQTAKNRLLMRADKPLFSILGYYGEPIDASADEVVFVASSERGSSLYRWTKTNGELERLSPSDTIVDAARIGDNKALVAEITDHGYEYKIVELTAVSERPFETTYFTESEPYAQALVPGADALAAAAFTETPAKTPDAARPSERYSSWSEWQFDGADPYLWFGVDAPALGGVALRFSDPLQAHSLTAVLNFGDFGQYGAGALYKNEEHIVNWDLAAYYAKDVDTVSDEDRDSGYRVIDRWDTWRAGTGVSSAFFKRPQWTLEAASHFIYEREQVDLYNPELTVSDIDNKFTLLTQLELSHAITPMVAYSPYRALQAELAHEFIHTAPDWKFKRNIYGGKLAASHDIFRQTYVSASYQAVGTDGRYAIIDFDDDADDFLFPSANQVRRNTPYRSVGFFEVQKFSAELKQAFDLSLYFKRFPISLRRLALIGEFNEYYGSTVHNESPDTLFHEAGGGAELELLLIHKLPFRLRAMSYKSSYADQDGTLISAGVRHEF